MVQGEPGKMAGVAKSAVKNVVVCADDFAVHAPASLGIARLAAAGRISATSVMVLSPRWAQDAALLQDLRDRIDVGLHLDWTSDFAMAAGHGLSLPAAMLKAVTGGFGRGAALAVTRAVIERQLDAFEARWKAPPDHVDGHQHVQQFAGIREALVQALARRYGANQEQGEHSQTSERHSNSPYLRISRPLSGLVGLKSRVIAAMGADALEKIAAHAQLVRAGALLGIYDFAGDQADYARHMAGWLSAAPAGSIIMCHPAQAVEPGDAIGRARAQEFAYLGCDDFSLALARAGVRLVRGRSL
jgi:chitin disaccharide deacetylase